MNVITCPYCESTYFDDEARCPYCLAPRPKVGRNAFYADGELYYVRYDDTYWWRDAYPVNTEITELEWSTHSWENGDQR